MMKLGQCTYVQVNPNGNVARDGQEAEAKHREQQRKDEIEGGPKRGHEKEEGNGGKKRPEN